MRKSVVLSAFILLVAGALVSAWLIWSAATQPPKIAEGYCKTTQLENGMSQTMCVN